MNKLISQWLLLLDHQDNNGRCGNPAHNIMAAGGSSNIARLVDCCDDPTLVGTLLSELPGSPKPHEESEPVEWGVENKYYTASILLHRHHWSEEWREENTACEALVVICNLTLADGLERVKECWSKMSAASPEVCLLVAVTDNSSGQQEDTELQEATQWCVENGFELIQWTPGEKQIASHNEEEEGGTTRVSMALQAHVWPVIKMKEQGSIKNSASTAASVTAGKFDDLSAEQLLARGIDGDVDGDEIDSFEELFGQFAAMKAHAESLPHEQRKVYAEQVVKSFWKAIGGDKDEIESDTETD